MRTTKGGLGFLDHHPQACSLVRMVAYLKIYVVFEWLIRSWIGLQKFWVDCFYRLRLRLRFRSWFWRSRWRWRRFHMRRFPWPPSARGFREHGNSSAMAMSTTTKNADPILFTPQEDLLALSGRSPKTRCWDLSSNQPPESPISIRKGKAKEFHRSLATGEGEFGRKQGHSGSGQTPLFDDKSQNLRGTLLARRCRDGELVGPGSYGVRLTCGIATRSRTAACKAETDGDAQQQQPGKNAPISPNGEDHRKDQKGCKTQPGRDNRTSFPVPS